MGNNEFQQPGDKGISKDAGDQSAGQLQRETQDRVSSTSYDSAKAGFMSTIGGDLRNCMSMKDDPKGFQEKTEALKNQSPEDIKATIAQNSQAAEAVKAYMASIDTKINNVLKAQKAQEELERANRTA